MRREVLRRRKRIAKGSGCWKISVQNLRRKRMDIYEKMIFYVHFSLKISAFIREMDIYKKILQKTPAVTVIQRVL